VGVSKGGKGGEVWRICGKSDRKTTPTDWKFSEIGGEKRHMRREGELAWLVEKGSVGEGTPGTMTKKSKNGCKRKTRENLQEEKSGTRTKKGRKLSSRNHLTKRAWDKSQSQKNFAQRKNWRSLGEVRNGKASKPTECFTSHHEKS